MFKSVTRNKSLLKDIGNWVKNGIPSKENKSKINITKRFKFIPKSSIDGERNSSLGGKLQIKIRKS